MTVTRGGMGLSWLIIQVRGERNGIFIQSKMSAELASPLPG